MKANEKEERPRVFMRRIVHAKREVVFDAWTNPEKMTRWFFCGSGFARVTNDLRVGGSYSLDMISASQHSECANGNVTAEGIVYPHTGEYLEVDPPRRLVFTWNSAAVTNSKVTIELIERGDETELLLTHEFLGNEKIRSEHEVGWTECLDKLTAFVS